MPALVTIPAVPILRVGMDYPLSSGKRTFAEEDLAAAASAYATDPAVKAPRIKIDAVTKALGLDQDAHGGEPAFGWFDNLRVSDNGQELLADAHVPEWVRDAMEWAYPSLSVEGTPPGWRSPTGRTHELVITAVALLGTDWPGCTTLDDFRDLLAKGPPVMDEPADVVVARMGPVTGSLDTDLVARRFYDALDGGNLPLPEGVDAAGLWIRSMRFDDDGSPYLKVTDEASGQLYRVRVSVTGTEASFSALEPIVEQDVPVTASTPPVALIASWGSREASRLAAHNHQEGHVAVNLPALRQRLGLAADADEATINAALEAPTQDPPQTQPPNPAQPTEDPPEQPQTPVTEPTDPSRPNEPQPPQPQPDQPQTQPDGMVLVDREQWESVRTGAEQGAQVAARMARQERDQTIRAAIGEGRFSPGRREHYERLWERDPDGTRHLLTADADVGGLARGLVPVTAEVGAAGDGDGASDAGEGTGWFNFDEQGA